MNRMKPLFANAKGIFIKKLKPLLIQVGIGVASHSTTCVFDHTLPVQMRVKPSLSLTSTSLRVGDTVSQGFTTGSGTVAQITYSGTQSITWTF